MDVDERMERMGRHLRYALRALGKVPVFTATVVLTLALGIGANSAVFSAIDAVLLRPLPFPDAGQLVTLGQINSKRPGLFVAPIRLDEWHRLNSTFQAISGYYLQDDSELSGELPEKLQRAFVAPRFLQVWGIAPILGRDFSPQEEHFGGPNAVLISERLWRRRFGANADVVNKMLRFGAVSVSIVGVMPASFLFPERDVDIWSPSPMDAPFAQNRNLTWFNAIGRMKPGMTLAQARANLAIVQVNLGRRFPNPDADITADIQPLKEVTVAGVRTSLWMLFGSVSLLLLIACTNVAALLLSRAAGREHEVAVQFALGASRMSIATQMLAEVLVLGLAGGGLGLLLAFGASGAFRAIAGNVPRIQEIGLNWRIVLYTLTCALVTTLLSGFVPAIRGTRRSLAGSLAQAGRSQVSGREAPQFVLVGVQVALAVTLLVGAGLLLRSFQQLGRLDPGFDRDHVLTFHVSTTWAETAEPLRARQRADRILEALAALPGVTSVATSMGLPGVPNEYQVEFRPEEGRAESAPKMLAQGRAVTSGYFATLRIPLLAGELCRDAPNTRTMMVNRSFADAYYAGSTAIGHRLQILNAPVPLSEIRGIVADAREIGLDRAPVPTVYWCGGANQPGTFFLVRTQGEPRATAETVRRTIQRLEPQRSVFDLVPLDEHLSDAYAEHRLRTILLACFALTAVALAGVGLYGTLSYAVNVRRREVGLRLALGALRTQVVRAFVAQGLLVSLLGGLAGLALATVFARLLSGMLYGVSASDPVALSGIAILVLAVSVVASVLPAIRAARVEPMEVLREE